MAKTPINTRRVSVEDTLAEGRRVQEAAVAAQEERDQAVPTPTQEENDRAKLGEDVQLEPSGTPETELEVRKAEEATDLAKRKAESAGETGTYKTRETKPE